MEVDTKQCVLKPVGVVHSPIREVADDCWGNVTAVIELDPARFTPESTMGLDEFSHLEVVFFLKHRDDSRAWIGFPHPSGICTTGGERK